MSDLVNHSMFIEGSVIAHYLILRVILLVIASFIAGYIDAIAGGAGLVLIPAFILTGLPPQLALGQEKLVSTIGTIAAIKNFVKNKSVIWRVIPAGLISAGGSLCGREGDITFACGDLIDRHCGAITRWFTRSND